MSNKKIPIAVARGDGIGPEIMKATLSILEAAGAPLEIHEVEIGEKVYLRGIAHGIEPSTWETLRHTKAFLKAPITTPQGGGFKSLNVTIRTAFGLYANIRPCIAYSPFVHTKHPFMDLVVIRENEEDLYSGIEYRQTPDVCTSIKLISRPGSEKIIRYAFEYARQYKRTKVTCFTKDNIMKFSDGLFHKIFDQIGAEYPDIEKEHWIVDIGAAKLADTPEQFEVIVLPNLYGDILSDVAAQISGSVGLAGSANIGDHGAMFEAIHGSAPRRANQDVANPSGLLLAAVLMLVHLNLPDIAATIHNSWLRTLEEGIHTYDIFTESISSKKVGTHAFAQAVIHNLGKLPQTLPAKSYQKKSANAPLQHKHISEPIKRELHGVDIYIYSEETKEILIKQLTSFAHFNFELIMISNRGATIYPNGQQETFCIDQYRCRFVKTSCCSADIFHLQELLTQQGFDIIKTENLYLFDGQPGFSGPSK